MRDLDRLYEFSNYYSFEVDLPVNIWIDESDSYKKGGHGPRIKFQTNTSTNMQVHNLASMDLQGNVHPLDKYLQSTELSSKDLDKIRQFVLNNADLLLALAKQEIRRKDFDAMFVPGYEKMSSEDKVKFKKNLDALVKKREEDFQAAIDYSKLLEL